VTAVAGTLIIGSFVAWITRKAQERRANNLLQEERIHAENQLRLQLIGQMTEAASSLYMATQHYWRKKEREEGVSNEELAEHRKELDQQYRASRVEGEVVERQLEAYFVDDAPRKHWHAAIDLLTVRYFQLVGLATPKLLTENAGDEHTGLSEKQLGEEKNRRLILQTYRDRLIKATRAVMQEPMRPLTG
jgi:hypothetical protein